MGLLKPLRRLVLKAVLRSALDFEQQIYGLFAALPGEMEGLELPGSLRRIIAEEQAHQKLLGDMIEERIPEAQIEALLSGSGPHLHDPDSVRPLPAQPYRGVIQRLHPILKREEDIWRFFVSLERKSRLPLAKQVFGFLAAEEQTHVRLLRRLLGEAEPEPAGP